MQQRKAGKQRHPDQEHEHEAHHQVAVAEHAQIDTGVGRRPAMHDEHPKPADRQAQIDGRCEPRHRLAPVQQHLQRTDRQRHLIARGLRGDHRLVQRHRRGYALAQTALLTFPNVADRHQACLQPGGQRFLDLPVLGRQRAQHAPLQQRQPMRAGCAFEFSVELLLRVVEQKPKAEHGGSFESGDFIQAQMILVRSMFRRHVRAAVAHPAA
ncbi:MAG: hypothetical protein LPK12_03845 [Rhodobacterales bacterium]|nr:hypothetical protein [Rhodobacterales bacterium]MDX5499115.1 hypothetical protein [Rhodobacterales bacterium]